MVLTLGFLITLTVFVYSECECSSVERVQRTKKKLVSRGQVESDVEKRNTERYVRVV